MPAGAAPAAGDCPHTRSVIRTAVHVGGEHALLQPHKPSPADDTLTHQSQSTPKLLLRVVPALTAVCRRVWRRRTLRRRG